MGNCCKSTPKPDGAGEKIGTLVFKGSGCCNCGPPWRFSHACCDPGKAPRGPEWEAAEPEFSALLEEVDKKVELASKCCGSPSPHSAMNQLKSSG